MIRQSILFYMREQAPCIMTKSKNWCSLRIIDDALGLFEFTHYFDTVLCMDCNTTKIIKIKTVNISTDVHFTHYTWHIYTRLDGFLGRSMFWVNKIPELVGHMALKVSWRDSMVKIRPGHGKSFVSSFNAKNYSETSLYYRVLYWISKLFIDSGSIDTSHWYGESNRKHSVRFVPIG